MPSPLRFDILTTFPEMFSFSPPGALAHSIPARARAAGLIEVVATNIRDFAAGPHHKTDDRPFGGGPGMVMACDPLFDAVMHAESTGASPLEHISRPVTRVLLTPQGVPLRQELVEDLATKPRLLLIAGHYEGIDERVIEELAPLEISVGDYILSGGELAALVLIDAVTRLLPGATGDSESTLQDSFGTARPPPGFFPTPKKRNPALPSLSENTRAHDAPDRDEWRTTGSPLDRPLRLLDCPHYTKPRVWREREVPEVLLSGDHGAIARWRHEQRLRRTMLRRPDLLP